MRIPPNWGDHIRCYVPSQDCQMLVELGAEFSVYLPRLSTVGISYLLESIKAIPTDQEKRWIATFASTGLPTPRTRVLDDSQWELIEQWWD